MTGNARVDELLDAMTAVSAQGDGATSPYPTDPSVSLRGDAADAGATRPQLVRADRAEESIGVTLSNAIVVLNTAPIHEPFGEEFDATLDRLDIAEPVMLVRESDVLELRRLLLSAKERAELQAEYLETARRNTRLAMAEARRLNLIVNARIVLADAGVDPADEIWHPSADCSCDHCRAAGA